MPSTRRPDRATADRPSADRSTAGLRPAGRHGTSRGASPASPRVERRRHLAASADVVWRHLTGADWLGLGDDDPPVGELLRLGDPFGGDGPRDARVLDVVVGRALVLEWWPAGRPDDRSVVTIEVAPSGTGAAVRVVEEAVPVVDVAARGRVWSSCLQALAGAVDATRSPFVSLVG